MPLEGVVAQVLFVFVNFRTQVPCERIELKFLAFAAFVQLADQCAHVQLGGAAVFQDPPPGIRILAISSVLALGDHRDGGEFLRQGVVDVRGEHLVAAQDAQFGLHTQQLAILAVAFAVPPEEASENGDERVTGAKCQHRLRRHELRAQHTFEDGVADYGHIHGDGATVAQFIAQDEQRHEQHVRREHPIPGNGVFTYAIEHEDGERGLDGEPVACDRQDLHDDEGGDDCGAVGFAKAPYLELQHTREHRDDQEKIGMLDVVQNIDEFLFHGLPPRIYRCLLMVGGKNPSQSTGRALPYLGRARGGA